MIDQPSTDRLGWAGALLASVGAVLGMGRVWQKVEAHDDLLKTMVPRSEFEQLGDKLDSLHTDVREIRRSLEIKRPYDAE